MIDSDINVSSQLQISIGCSYRSALNNYAARVARDFTAPTAFCRQLLCRNNQEIFAIHKTSIALQTKFLKLGVHTEYNSEI